MKKGLILLVMILTGVMMMSRSVAESEVSVSSAADASFSDGMAVTEDVVEGYYPGMPRPVTPPPFGNYTLGSRTLRLTSPYMRGSDVRELQRMLNALGFSCGRADGLYGSKTRAAVKAFQLRNGLAADGVFGWRTRAVLLAKYRGRR